jgi:hypothetical protein
VEPPSEAGGCQVKVNESAVMSLADNGPVGLAGLSLDANEKLLLHEFFFFQNSKIESTERSRYGFYRHLASKNQ